MSRPIHIFSVLARGRVETPTAHDATLRDTKSSYAGTSVPPRAIGGMRPSCFVPPPLSNQGWCNFTRCRNRKCPGWADPTPQRRIQETDTETRAGEENPTALKKLDNQRTTSVSALAVRLPMGKVCQRLGKRIYPGSVRGAWCYNPGLPVTGELWTPLTTVTLGL